MNRMKYHFVINLILWAIKLEQSTPIDIYTILYYDDEEAAKRVFKEPYNDIALTITIDDKKEAIKWLLENKYIKLFNSDEIELKEYDIEEVLSDISLWRYRFTLTPSGKTLYKEKSNIFWTN